MNLPPILIVDDAIFNVFSLQLVLEKSFNLKSDFAYNGEDAIQKIKERHFKTSHSIKKNMHRSRNFQVSRLSA